MAVMVINYKALHILYYGNMLKPSCTKVKRNIYKDFVQLSVEVIEFVRPFWTGSSGKQTLFPV